MIRIVHRFSNLPDKLVGELERIRGIAGDVELYKTMATAEEEYALALLVDSEQTFGDLLDLTSYQELLLGEVETQCYLQKKYMLKNDRWVPEKRPHPVISWPLNGPVSIVIQTACQANTEFVPLTAHEIFETRREPGCLHYAWYQNVQEETDLLLLEIWEDSQAYDIHWFGRIRSAEYRGDSGRKPANRTRGEITREFYSYQVFEYQYGRLQPTDLSKMTETVEWLP